MAKLCLKKPSKRMPARRRYKIEKRIRDHNKKKRREAKKLGNKPSKKLIHVPNICPFKEDILKDVEEYKKRKEEERLAAREQAKEEREAKKATNLTELAQQAQSKEHEEVIQAELTVKKGSDNNYKTYYREFQKVVHSADVILEVVDARDPLGTRCHAVETCVKASNEHKRLILVLNKADLVPRETLDKWLRHLRCSTPAIPFKSSTQAQNSKLGRRKMKRGKQVKSDAVCVGAEGIMNLLGNYCRNKGLKTAIRVGVVGLPNVGKSSLINSLKRSRACAVGATPGITRNLQEVILDSKIKLLDSPGLAFAAQSDPHAALKNTVQTTDAITPAEMILQRVDKNKLRELYLISDYTSPTECLVLLAKRCGKFKKGGIADPEAAAKILLDDWNKGKITYHVEPPEESNAHEIASSIVTKEAAEFDLEAYDGAVLRENGVGGMEVEGEEEEEMEGEGEEEGEDTKSLAGSLVVTMKKKRFRKKKKTVEGEKKDSMMELEGNRKMNKLNKLRFKKQKKTRARNERTAKQLSSVLDNISL